MTAKTREQILNRLKNAPRSAPYPSRPALPPMAEESMDMEALVERFKTAFEAQTGVLKRVAGGKGVLEALAQVFAEEGITSAVASTDQVLAELNLPEWARRKGLNVTTCQAPNDRQAFKNEAFTEADAGITGADYGFAESGTLCLLAGRYMPRLTSLAPPIHIAVLPTGRLLPTYEHMIRPVFGKTPPSQVIWITGPSMTADIQATPFKGMHGPKRVIVILKED